MGSGASGPTSKRSSAMHLTPLSNFYTIANNFQTFLDLQNGLKAAGLESSELIIGIDFTKSNLYNGAVSFGGKSLHDLTPLFEETPSGSQNPYEYVLNNICQTMAAFDDDNQIPCYGFGDVTTRNQKVFSFKTDLGSCSGLREVQALYREHLPNISLAGPTSFAPIIRLISSPLLPLYLFSARLRKAIHIVAEHDFRYHVL
jgi:E3 ubiquitin-protein ligase RGLG